MRDRTLSEASFVVDEQGRPVKDRDGIVPDNAFRPPPGIHKWIPEASKTVPVLPLYVVADLGSGWYTILKSEDNEDTGARVWKPYISHLGADAAQVVVKSLNEAAARGAL